MYDGQKRKGRTTATLCWGPRRVSNQQSPVSCLSVCLLAFLSPVSGVCSVYVLILCSENSRTYMYLLCIIYAAIHTDFLIRSNAWRLRVPEKWCAISMMISCCTEA
ncbi:hypothetical protein F5B20DRAFT_134814 [Whalleya microplaca]|nr:hypothetical protein F5B20DRAFT_134814 [Whalleya microplaca]